MKDKSIGVVLRDLKRGDTLWGRITAEGKIECNSIQFLVEASDLIVHKPDPSGGLLMPFGKYKNQGLGDIPDSYYDWLLDQDWFAEARWVQLRLAIEKELEFRSTHPKSQSKDQSYSLEDLDPRRARDEIPF
jgi:uncharacterized protein (DUF3820 family)